MNLDTSTPTGKLMLNLMGSFAEFEREIMLERQREGVARAKAEGKYRGRVPTAQRKAAEVFSYGARVSGPRRSRPSRD
jgi:DNA invertase Pin-like site-specific DNA recombinase